MVAQSRGERSTRQASERFSIALCGAAALHAAIIAAGVLMRRPTEPPIRAGSVVVQLVSSGPPFNNGARAQQEGPARPLDAFADRFSAAAVNPARPRSAPSDTESLSQLMGEANAGAGTTSDGPGEEPHSSGPGDGEADPHARASTPRVTDRDALALVPLLSKAAQRCWTSAAAHTRITLSIELDDHGRLLSGPMVIGYEGAGASTDLGRRAAQAVAACAPYQIAGPGRRTGRFELALE